MSAYHITFRGASAVRAAAAACLLVLTACGGSGGGEASGKKEVASLPSSVAPSTSTSKGGGGSKQTEASSTRPQMRLDMTDEERQALIDAWDACLVKHGARYAQPGEQAGPAGNTKAGLKPSVADPVPQSAKNACTNKLPLLPPELDPGRNPHYRDDWVANVKCLRDHGIKVHLVEDNSDGDNALAWTFDDNEGAVPADMTQIEHNCELAAFGGKK